MSRMVRAGDANKGDRNGTALHQCIIVCRETSSDLELIWSAMINSPWLRFHIPWLSMSCCVVHNQTLRARRLNRLQIVTAGAKSAESASRPERYSKRASDGDTLRLNNGNTFHFHSFFPSFRHRFSPSPSLQSKHSFGLDFSCNNSQVIRSHNSANQDAR